MYGTFAKNVWRYTDGHMICSSAITNSGQRLTKASIDYVNGELGNVMEMSKDELMEYFELDSKK
jgi:hypothetical protein